ncbi:Gfo/Idh/MocA family protein [Clostridium celatum]|uniref:Oxidoreductase, NAD-binding domain protein n=1 Tax=Clostridium celatum DSM 1785 TaxID=545697 RepID=L1QBV6_9CLOT|nr:Gfo/Idh/MocA family oxidoreductase [Clostridium celatum]EKY25426.1 oxidoreductase, NAD-binding domain protein [Clostridium celatum DSM 1785]MCE9655209.1 Gfo/Idh/MocA family oxidoreductase [Clostridium celatum]MDU3724010.1 Gfo/Idh/MocA family oxidoreductase [Clostridium celatum]MDU6296261.1 Gfo/Idh/MocA family oxidoreductase [Clostridium celatum]
MRIGIIGIGDICKKAYLPVITLRNDIEIILCTRNTETLNEVKKTYRLSSAVESIQDLINSKIDVAFVHSSTESHFEICKTLIENKIHVYVDKPLCYTYAEVLELYNLSKNNNVKLMIGFNRRFCPKVRELHALGHADIIIMEKNRVNLPGDIRTFIFDDFIHVIDTVRFLMMDDYTNFTVDFKTDKNLLNNVVLKLSNSTTTSLAIMNRDNGVTEETIEYMASGKKALVTSLVETTSYCNNNKSITSFGDWDNTLYKRGFVSIINEFLDAIKNNSKLPIDLEDSLKTHKLCEDIVNYIVSNS